jgi:hypothetical protein
MLCREFKLDLEAWSDRLSNYLKCASEFDKSRVMDEIIPSMGKLTDQFYTVFPKDKPFELSFQEKQYSITLSKREIATLISGKF